LRRKVLPRIFSNPMVFPSPGTVHPELVEGCAATTLMLRQAQHERLILQRLYNYRLISMMFNRKGHLDHEREAVPKGGERQENNTVTCGKLGSSRRPGLALREPPSPPVR
jgi:hypothetical protein